MKVLALNGFGRIGKSFLRAILLDPQARKALKVGVINVGKGDPQAAALAFKYDTLMGIYPGNVRYEDGKLYIEDLAIPVISELDPEKALWKSFAINWVVEATGFFTTREGAEKHLKAGAQAVLITAPAKDEDITIIPGVNANLFDPQKHTIVSLGSCTSNAIFTMIKVLQDAFGIDQVYMTTIHAYTNTQPLLDVDATVKDLRRGRAAALNIVPTTTGAMAVIGKLFPHLAGKAIGISLRVPVAKVSLLDLTTFHPRPTSREEVNSAFETAARTNLKGILTFTTEPLVSSDYNNNSHSAIIDGLMTEVQGTVSKTFGWYDNEWGYAERLKDFLLYA